MKFEKVKDEYYHVYNRGAHKEPIFIDKSDYQRFVLLLHVANDTIPLRPNWIHKDPWNITPIEKLVDIFCYCLMPNHFHIGLKTNKERGVEIFIHKICTSYSMYFNKKYNHSGTILQGQYKSKHIDSDDYYRYLIDYIHLNPYGVEEPNMNKYSKREYLQEAIELSKNYEYSSYKDYLGIIRPQNIIISRGLPSEGRPPRNRKYHP
jgi:putative transposase